MAIHPLGFNRCGKRLQGQRNYKKRPLANLDATGTSGMGWLFPLVGWHPKGQGLLDGEGCSKSLKKTLLLPLCCPIASSRKWHQSGYRKIQFHNTDHLLWKATLLRKKGETAARISKNVEYKVTQERFRLSATPKIG